MGFNTIFSHLLFKWARLGGIFLIVNEMIEGGGYYEHSLG